MMAKKSELFDKEMIVKILETPSPSDVKKLGREIKNYDENIWVKNRFEIVKQGNLHKFSQHESLKHFLLNTTNTILVEASHVDTIWGIGMASDNKDANNPKLWQGLNLLGFALMDVRDELNKK